MSWFDMPGGWMTAFAEWFNVLVQWVTLNAAQLLASLPELTNTVPPGADLPATNVAATPELDSFVLFGTGLAGAAGYALTRIMARRRA